MTARHAFVIGSYVAGCIARTSRFPAPGETIAAQSFLLQPGGKGFNMLAGLHRLGGPAVGLLPVGDDLWGRMAPGLMTEMELPATWLVSMPGASGGAVGLAAAQGENIIAIAPGANARLAPEHIEARRDLVTTAAWVVAQFEVPDAPILTAFGIARAHGARTLLNPSPWRDADMSLLALSDIVVVNETEASALSTSLGLDPGPEPISDATEQGARLSRLAAALHAGGTDTLIVTLGAAGAMAFPRAGGVHVQPAFPVEVVDTTGAGDAFNAGLLRALLDDLPLPVALRWGAACGAEVTRGLGVIDHLPDHTALSTRLASG